jgi:hypothetical protein
MMAMIGENSASIAAIAINNEIGERMTTQANLSSKEY